MRVSSRTILLATFTVIVSWTYAETSLAGDVDADGHSDVADNCPFVSNPNQPDGDSDGFGDGCDADYNNDGAIDETDLGLFQQSFNSSVTSERYSSIFDHNGDGLVDAADFITHVSLSSNPR